MAMLNTLLQWHIDDPVDDFERNRNDVIYGYQNNRNPFIDYPEFVGMIFGPVPLSTDYMFLLSEMDSTMHVFNINYDLDMTTLKRNEVVM
jgi:hypothetical protein